MTVPPVVIGPSLPGTAHTWAHAALKNPRDKHAKMPILRRRYGAIEARFWCVENICYEPVAVALQVSVKVKLLFAGNVAIAIPAPCNAPTVGDAGQTAAPAVTAQVTVEQVSPATAGSVNNAPLAAEGPPLATTMV